MHDHRTSTFLHKSGVLGAIILFCVGQSARNRIILSSCGGRSDRKRYPIGNIKGPSSITVKEKEPAARVGVPIIGVCCPLERRHNPITGISHVLGEFKCHISDRIFTVLLNAGRDVNVDSSACRVCCFGFILCHIVLKQNIFKDDGAGLDHGAAADVCCHVFDKLTTLHMKLGFVVDKKTALRNRVVLKGHIIKFNLGRLLGRHISFVSVVSINPEAPLCSRHQPGKNRIGHRNILRPAQLERRVGDRAVFDCDGLNFVCCPGPVVKNHDCTVTLDRLSVDNTITVLTDG
ncbi:unknown [Sutterella sp. CAG:397]|nr:unknown [Sutterella sp. CAG:397]